MVPGFAFPDSGGFMLRRLLSYFLIGLLAFLPFSANAGLFKKTVKYQAARIVVKKAKGVAAKKIAQKAAHVQIERGAKLVAGRGTSVESAASKKKLASKFWSKMKGKPDMAEDVAAGLRQKAMSNPADSGRLNALAGRIEKNHLNVNETFNTKIKPTTVNGRSVRNQDLAGQGYPNSRLPVSRSSGESVRSKYQNDVPLNQHAEPDFSRYSLTKVKIKPTGVRAADDLAANREAAKLTAKGLTPKGTPAVGKGEANTFGSRFVDANGKPQTPKGYTWHHKDADGTMELVETNIHSKVGHTGGFAKGK